MKNRGSGKPLTGFRQGNVRLPFGGITLAAVNRRGIGMGAGE